MFLLRRKSIHALYSIEAICGLKARYFRYLDTKMWGELGQLFTVDAVFLIPEIKTELNGREEIITWAVTHLEKAITIHRGHQPEIQRVDTNSATGIWAMSDYIERPGVADNSPLIFRGYGYYYDVYRRGRDGWQIERTELERLRVFHSDT